MSYIDFLIRSDSQELSFQPFIAFFFLNFDSLYINMVNTKTWLFIYCINRLLQGLIHTFLWFGIRSSSYQCNQVPGVLTAELSTAAEDYQCDKEDCIGNIVCPWIHSNKVLGIIDKGEDGNEGESDQKLHCENHEDLVGKRN